MYCPHCGSQVNGKSRFCPACGRSVYIVKEQRKRASFLPAFLILLIILAIGAAYVVYSFDLYYNESSCDIDADIIVRNLIKLTEIETYYNDTYLMVENDDYTIFSPKYGAFESISSNELGVINENGETVDIQYRGNYAHLIITDTELGYTVTYFFRKATFAERLRFISLYFAI